jgi:pilus assembly protein CpaC
MRPAILFGMLMGMAAFVPVAPASAATSNLTLHLREQRKLDVPPALERITVADPDVADVIVMHGKGKTPGKSGNAVLLVAKKAGVTTVSAWSKGVESNVWQVRVLGDAQGALDPAQQEHLQLRGSTALISGQSPSMLAHANIVAAASEAAGKGTVIDNSTVATGGVVQIDVKIVEMSKSVLKEAGFNLGFNFWRGSYLFDFASQLAPVNSAISLVARNTHGSNGLALLETNGLARVLAEPTLTALSGQSASFLAGGELPIPQAGGLGTTSIVYKPFGIGLTVAPTVLAANRIALKVAPEASDIDYANAVTVADTQIPAITTRRADTTVELGDGESFVIGGLVSRNTKSNVSKIPLLGDLPIIGAFFRSLNYTQDEKELVIVVTPHLVRPIAANANLPLPGEGRDRTDTRTNAWGAYLLGDMAGRDDLPGFAK